MIRQPPSYTLFPSTPPFRSFAGAVFEQQPPLELLKRDGGCVTRVLRRSVNELDEVHERSMIDRKSTRLNSSHANISYAVFCLKKKNKSPTELLKITKPPPSS